MRIAVRENSTLGGLLDKPMTQHRTAVVFKIGAAATHTRNHLFTFGTGVEHRSCIFVNFLFAFVNDLHLELHGQYPGGAATNSHAAN